MHTKNVRVLDDCHKLLKQASGTLRIDIYYISSYIIEKYFNEIEEFEDIAEDEEFRKYLASKLKAKKDQAK